MNRETIGPATTSKLREIAELSDQAIEELARASVRALRLQDDLRAWLNPGGLLLDVGFDSRTLEEKAAAILAELEDGIHDLYRIHAEALAGALTTKDEVVDLWRESKVMSAEAERAVGSVQS
jgi:hypothetical protein